jgi:dipeptidyl aminopeptidase/acylaminoacyl peptidase
MKNINYIAIILMIFTVVFNTAVADNIINSDSMKEDKLIEREILFGNPEKSGVQISHDGKYISYLAPNEGVLNVWITKVDDILNAKLITSDEKRGIRDYFWSKDSQYIIYAQDKKGDENWRLYSVNISNLQEKDLTPSNEVRASVLKLSDKFPKEMLIYLNARVPEYFDIHKVNIETGKLETIYKNTENYSSFIADDDFNIRLGYKMLSSGEGEIYLFENGDIKLPKLFKKISFEDMLNTTALHISKDNKKLFMFDSAGRNTSALVEINLESMERKVIHESMKADIDDYIIDVKTKMVQASAINYIRKEWTIVDESIRSDLDYLTKLEDGDVEIVSRSAEDDKWIVVYLKSDSPYRYYLYNRTKKEATFLFVSNSSLDKEPLAKMHPVVIKSRDGLDLVCYITIPRWLDNGSGIPSKPTPMVLNVHGGPNARDRWGYSSEAQWLANRGYTTISVNYRGSTGFGKEFIKAGDGEWARKMQDDLEDAVSWAVKNKIAIKDKVAIMGGSYGGYATLVGLAMTPDLYVAGIDIVGPSNLETLLRSIPKYWRPYMAHLTKMMGGSYETEEGCKLLKERSPLTYASNIKKPLLIVQGANDPRVKQVESDQIVEAMKNSSIPVVYLLYPDEGHGLARPENRLSMYANAEVFLANFAGGRFVTHDNEFPGSSVEVKEGKDIKWTKIKE